VEPGTEHVALNASDAAQLADAVAGAAVIYLCASPAYHRWPAEWPALADAVISAAGHSGATLVVLSNLYGYGPVEGKLTEDLPARPAGPKGQIRAEVWARVLRAHESGRIRAAEVRASDFFGPGVTSGGHLASRVIPPLLRGKTVRVLGDPGTPHSWTYVPDVASALVAVGETEDAWGRPWHVPTAPPQSITDMVGELSRQAAVPPVPVRQLPAGLLRALGVVSPLLRELREVTYQFDRPFIVDSTAFTARFGQTATPLADQVRATLRWWRERLGASLQ